MSSTTIKIILTIKILTIISVEGIDLPFGFTLSNRVQDPSEEVEEGDGKRVTRFIIINETQSFTDDL